MLTVVTPADTYDLTLLATVKTELGLTTTADDVFLAELIRQASGDVARYCRRVLALETVRETFRSGRCGHRASDPVLPLWLARCPVNTVTSVTEYETVLVAGTDYEVDAETGALVRLAGAGYGAAIHWGGFVSVVYSGGYELLGELPYDIERAAMDLIKRRYYGRSRDPALRSQQVLDLVNKSFTSDGSEPGKRGLPLSVAERLDDYVSLLA